MKIVRALGPDGEPCHFEPLTGNRGRLLEGSVSAGFRVTDKEMDTGDILAPLVPPLIIGIAQNYRAHAAEMRGQLVEPIPHPVFFIKMPGSIQNPGGPIRIPRDAGSEKVDFEAELAVVIGRQCRNVPEKRAMEYVFGYTAANDVTARDWQKEWGGGQFCRGKGFDTFCPLGPCLVTVDEIPDPGNLAVRGYLNGQLMQDGHTRDLIFSVPRLIAFLSADTTLPAGTVILTSTPSGVGAARKPPVFLRTGDCFRVEVERIGFLENCVVDE